MHGSLLKSANALNSIKENDSGGGGTSIAAMVCTESVTKRMSRASSTSFVIDFPSTLMFCVASSPLAVSNDNNNPFVGP